MSAPSLFSETTFHPAGQGLFVSGQVQCLSSGAVFTWVFDCGAESRDWPALKIQAIAFVSANAGAPLDMVCISHFDQDHVRGLELLLNLRGAKTLILPYVPLHQRLLLAVSSGATGFHLSFLVNPAAAILGITGGETRVAFVAPSAEPGSDIRDERDFAIRNDNDPDPDVSEPNSRTTVHIELDPLPEEYGDTFLLAGAQVGLIRNPKSAPVSVGRLRNCWEFSFYNEPRPELSLTGLDAAVQACIANHSYQHGRYSQLLIPALRRIYATYFGTRRKAKGIHTLESYPANRISLVMHSGPLLTLNGTPIVSGHPSNAALKGGLILTGDIYANSRQLLRSIKTHFGAGRWQDTLVFQVPHHGSDKNWAAGNSADCSHLYSVIPFGTRNTHGHPGPIVIADLAGTTIVNVTEFLSFTYHLQCI